MGVGVPRGLLVCGESFIHHPFSSLEERSRTLRFAAILVSCFVFLLQEEGFEIFTLRCLFKQAAWHRDLTRRLKGKGEGGRLAGAAMHYLLLLSHVWSQPGLQCGIMDCKAPLYAQCGRCYILDLSHSSKPWAMLCAG